MSSSRILLSYLLKRAYHGSAVSAGKAAARYMSMSRSLLGQAIRGMIGHMVETGDLRCSSLCRARGGWEPRAAFLSGKFLREHGQVTGLLSPSLSV